METEDYRLCHLYAYRATALHSRRETHLGNRGNSCFVKTACACAADYNRVYDAALLIYNKLNNYAAFNSGAAGHVGIAKGIVKGSLTANHFRHVFYDNENFIFEIVCWRWRWWWCIKTSIEVKEGVHIDELIVNDGIIRYFDRYRRTRWRWGYLDNLGLNNILDFELDAVNLLNNKFTAKIEVEFKQPDSNEKGNHKTTLKRDVIVLT